MQRPWATTVQWLAILALAGGLAACSEDPAAITPPTTDADEVVDEIADDVTDDTAVPDTVADGDDVPDATDLDIEETLEEVAVDAAEVGPDAAGCQGPEDCTAKLTLKSCQAAACEEGVCKAVTMPGGCCDDAECDDQVDCTSDICDPATHKCGSEPIANCCSGKVTLLKTGFEAGGLEEFVVSDAATNGNVQWQATNFRAHSGKSALYLGNECRTYDNGMSGDEGCQPGAVGTAVSSQLTSKEYALPKEKSAHLHFWLYLDTEPPYVGTLPKGNCATPCGPSAACISVNGAPQCVPEKDVLSIQVVTADKSAAVFHSTSIGKTTGGNWRHVAVDLSEWAGQNVKLQWQFQTGTALKNGYEGVYLDDIVVETVCAEGTACNATTPCVDDDQACTIDACTTYANLDGAGFCFSDKKVGCCLGNSDCGDGNSCTVDTCVEGTCSHAPDATQPTCCKPEVLLYDDFDTGDLTTWSVKEANSNLAKWRIDPTGGVSGSDALFFGTEAMTGYADAQLVDDGPTGTICSGPVVLKSGTLFDLLTFDLQLVTEWSGQPATAYLNPPFAGQPKFDEFTVQVYYNGVFTQAWSSDTVYGTTEGEWVAVTVPLDAWAGKTVNICLKFDAGDPQTNDEGGVRIDNLVAKVACAKKSCYFDSQCAQMTCANQCGVPACTEAGCACVAKPGCCSSDADCDDANACTVDTCGMDTKCIHSPSNGEGCPG
jgi:hypothetical protein